MKCERLLCIYQRDDLCVFPEEIMLDWRGICRNYCPIDITGKELWAQKRQMLEDYEGAAFAAEYDAKYR